VDPLRELYLQVDVLVNDASQLQHLGVAAQELHEQPMPVRGHAHRGLHAAGLRKDEGGSQWEMRVTWWRVVVNGTYAYMELEGSQ
jgi:cytochrome b involved in lipid metabolism